MSLHGECRRSQGKIADFLFDNFHESIPEILQHECEPLDKQVKVDGINNYLKQAAFARHQVGQSLPQHIVNTAELLFDYEWCVAKLTRPDVFREQPFNQAGFMYGRKTSFARTGVFKHVECVASGSLGTYGRASLLKTNPAVLETVAAGTVTEQDLFAGDCFDLVVLRICYHYV